MELPRGAKRCEKADSIGGEQPYLQHLFSGKQECFAGKVGTEKWWRRIRASQPSSRIRHFERMREIFFVRGQAKVGGQREAGSTVFLKTCNHGVSRKLIHAGNRKRQTKKIPRLRSG